MDKASRLGGKLDAVLARFQAFAMQAEIDLLRGNIDRATYERRTSEIEDAKELIAQTNRIGFINDETMEKLHALCTKKGIGPKGEEPFFTDDEQVCLLVRKGTLTDEERAVMESHVTMTRRILSDVRFPKKFRMVPVWAASHHEFLDGKGYPDRLAGDDIPEEVRIVTILDIYDALTARDRPYKCWTTWPSTAKLTPGC
jgi:hypothetical protein